MKPWTLSQLEQDAEKRMCSLPADWLGSFPARPTPLWPPSFFPVSHLCSATPGQGREPRAVRAAPQPGLGKGPFRLGGEGIQSAHLLSRTGRRQV